MYARVTTAQTTPENLEPAVKRVREQYLPEVRGEGAKGYLVLIDRTSGKAMTIALYETEDALQRAEQSAQARAATATAPLTAPRETVIYEVAEDARF
jgi:hypothetical protein